MRNRRNNRKIGNIKEIISNKNFIKICAILFTIIFLSIGIIFVKNYKAMIELAKQKEQLEKETEEIFIDIEETINKSSSEKSAVATISVVGDILCGTDMIVDAKEENNYNFEKMAENIKEYTSKSDISIGTLETNFVNSNYSGISKYNAPEEMLKMVKSAGIDLVSVAHNHELDYGIDGLKETIEKIKSNEIDVTGIKEDENEFSGKIKEVNNIKIAVLGYTYGLSNAKEISQEDMAYANIYEEEKVKNDIEYAKKNSDFIIVLMHWGDVNSSKISQWQNDVTNFLVQNDVDMILGSHPSVIEPMQVIKNSEGKNVLIAYSLGNYISSLTYENANIELILNIKIIKDKESNTTILQKVDYTPVYLLDNGKDSENRYELYNMKELAINYANGDKSKISKKQYEKILKKIEWLEEIVNNK